jgi:hypothetical protein
MGDDEAALLRLWQEKRGEAGPEDLSGNLIVQLGLATEDLNRLWYQRNTGQTIECVQHRLRHPVFRGMGATLDGMVAASGAVFEGQVHAAVFVLRGGGGPRSTWPSSSTICGFTVSGVFRPQPFRLPARRRTAATRRRGSWDVWRRSLRARRTDRPADRRHSSCRFR